MALPNTAVTKAAVAYFEALVANGLFVIDATGAGSINPTLDDVMNALHEVLAGGRVSVTVSTPGNAGIKAALSTAQRDALTSMNVPAATGGGTIFTP